jgi:trimethylamine-N-oxide reductase (cytochrome c)
MDVGGNRRTTCSTAGSMFVTEKDGKVIRVEPMQFDPEEVDSWEVSHNGKTYTPPLTQPMLPWGHAFKQVMFSENRVNYPMKRVDWNPDGERNPQNRGVSGYERISWDEAFEVLEKEMKRVIDTYGNSALAASFSAHPEWGELHYFFSDWFRFWHAVGSTTLDYSPISWEGWAAGATFAWGFWSSMGFPPGTDTLQDVTEHSELIILWGTDPIMHNIHQGVGATGRTSARRSS